MISNRKYLIVFLFFATQIHANVSKFAHLATSFCAQLSNIAFNVKSILPNKNFQVRNFKNYFFNKKNSLQPSLSQPPKIIAQKRLTVVDPQNKEFQLPEPHTKDMAELTKLVNQTKIFPNQQQVIAHYKIILEKKWKELAADFERFLELHPGILDIEFKYGYKEEYLKKPYSPEEDIKKEYSEPLKKIAKKGIWLTDMLTPFDEQKKQLFRSHGIGFVSLNTYKKEDGIKHHPLKILLKTMKHFCSECMRHCPCHKTIKS